MQNSDVSIHSTRTIEGQPHRMQSVRKRVNNDEDGVEALAEGEAFNKVHGDGGPGAFGDG